MILGFGGHEPQTGGAAFIAPDAVLVGNVFLGQDASVWFGAVIRADEDAIVVGEGSNIQDRAVLHTDPGLPLMVGRGVTVGHGAILHGCTIGDNCVIGMGAIILNHARIGDHSLVGAGALVKEGSSFPPYSLIVGSPAEVKKSLKEIHVRKLKEGAVHYQNKARAMQTILGIK